MTGAPSTWTAHLPQEEKRLRAKQQHVWIKEKQRKHETPETLWRSAKFKSQVRGEIKKRNELLTFHPEQKWLHKAADINRNLSIRHRSDAGAGQTIPGLGEETFAELSADACGLGSDRWRLCSRWFELLWSGGSCSLWAARFAPSHVQRWGRRTRGAQQTIHVPVERTPPWLAARRFDPRTRARRPGQSEASAAPVGWRRALVPPRFERPHVQVVWLRNEETSTRPLRTKYANGSILMALLYFT